MSTAEHLTAPNPQLAEFQRRTPSGMAHWSGSGPEGVTCRECLHWNNCGVQSGYYAKGGKRGGVLKPRRCRKYKSMMQGRQGDAVPHETAACKYFEKNATPPSIVWK